jgi:REP element-mobilizing transposase RayT
VRKLSNPFARSIFSTHDLHILSRCLQRPLTTNSSKSLERLARRYEAWQTRQGRRAEKETHEVSANYVARKLRLEYPGAIYHVMSRGDRREPIFKDDLDRRAFLDTLGQACSKTSWQVHAYCLMANHFHLVLETPLANPVAGMKWFLGTYTIRFNRRHKLVGHLFGGRYEAIIVDGSGNGYLRTVCDYVHLNPVRAGLLTEEQPFRTCVWSSYGDYLEAPAKRPAWLRADRLLGELGIPRDSAAGRRQFERRMEERRWHDTPGQWKGMEQGWCLGDEEFRQELLAQMEPQMGRYHGGQERQETATTRAERLLAEELHRSGWTAADLSRRRKGDPEKVSIARRLRNETTMTLDWIAARLHMGAAGYAAECLRQGAR